MNETLITEALGRLLTRKDDGAFVVITEETTSRFVQFAGSSREPLILDAPRRPLPSDERAAIEQLFAGHDGLRVTEESVQVVFGRDVGAAADAALRIFREVYRLDADIRLVVRDESGDDRDEPEEAVCDRCGALAPGRRQWMFYPLWYSMIGAGTGREFFCFRCHRIMRFYAVIGFSLLGIVIAGIIGMLLWIRLNAP